ncbi:MAG: DUF1559 domain-containing protein [Planctomycetaceae bacterium]|jgi:prepilin-type N-terminal cleavage/methylation domain-containing protein|nr:DUF1559 domain-containing protein [Planctomycetaceae bacterium]
MLKKLSQAIRKVLQKGFRGGFTLVELLVVIAIIGVLIALLLPAVQAAREAARRMQCANHLKQYGLAMHTYMDAWRQYLPCGNSHPTGGFQGTQQRHTWMPRIWPYIEQQALYSQYRFDIGFYASPNNEDNQTAITPTSSKVSIYYCPSDRPGAMWTGDVNYCCRANYVTNMGNDWFWHGTSTAGAPYPYKLDTATNRWTGAPFYLNIYVDASEISDGLSNTMFLSELLCAEDNHFDFRGYIFNDEGPGASYMTVTGPNSRTPDACICKGSGSEATSAPSTIATASLSTKMPCTNLVGSATGDERWQTARSKHTGGVNVCLGDGSGTFVSETIAIDVWRAIGSAHGGESKGL